MIYRQILDTNSLARLALTTGISIQPLLLDVTPLMSQPNQLAALKTREPAPIQWVKEVF